MFLLVALVAALCYAAAMVLQQHSAADVDRAASLRPALITALLRRPWWLAGIAANLLGYGLRYVALSGGSLVLVQPVLATSLLFALPASARWDRTRLRERDWVGAVALAGGVVLFLVAARPTAGRAGASGTAWLVTAIAVGAAVAIAVSLSARLRDDARARLLAAAGGLAIALVAALTKATADSAGDHLLPRLTTWEPYALVLAAAVGLLVVQSAFNAGPLASSLPTLMVVETVGGVALGMILFGEGVHAGTASRLAEVAGLVLMVAGIVLVAGRERERVPTRT